MTPENLLLNTFEGKPTPRAPVVPKIWFDLAARLTGAKPQSMIQDPMLALTALADAVEDTRSDAVRVIMMKPRQTRVEGEKLVEIENGKAIGAIDLSGGWATHLEDPGDFNIENPEHTGFRIYRKHEAPRVESVQDAARIAVPDRAFWEAHFGAHVDAIKKRVGDRIALIGDCDSATLAWYIDFRGMEQAMFDLLEEPELVHAIMEKGVSYAVERGRFCIDHGMRVLRLNDSIANMSVISPELWRRFVFPHMREVCAELHAYCKDVKIYCHICGNVLPVIEDLVATGLDSIGPMDPLGGFTVAQARERAGELVTLLGGVNTMDFIQSPPEKIKALAMQCIAEGQVHGSRYILSSGCALPRDSKRENLIALRDASEEARRVNP